MLSNRVSTMISARFFVRPAVSATSSTSAAFVRVPSDTGRAWQPARAGAASACPPFPEGQFQGSDRDPAGVTEEHRRGPETARFPRGRSPTPPRPFCLYVGVGL